MTRKKPQIERKYIKFIDARNTLSQIAEVAARGYFAKLKRENKMPDDLIILTSSSGTLVNDMNSKENWRLFNIMQDYLQTLCKKEEIDIDEQVTFKRWEKPENLRSLLHALKINENNHIIRILKDALLFDPEYINESRIFERKQTTTEQKANLILTFSTRDFDRVYGMYVDKKRRPKMDLLSYYASVTGEYTDPFVLSISEGLNPGACQQIGKNIVQITRKAMKNYFESLREQRS